MRRDVLIVAVVVVAVLVIAVAAVLVSSLMPAHAEIAGVGTDKDLYHSHETMKIAVLVRSSGQMDNTTMLFTGIEDKNGRMRLSHEIPANITSDQTIINYDYELPACSKCAGLDPGNYQINVTLERNGIAISNATHIIKIEQ
jgi:hypothetical protein